MKEQFFGKQVQRFSIRKYSLGAVSVLLGTLLFLGNPIASADQVATTQPDDTSLVAPTDKELNVEMQSDDTDKSLQSSPVSNASSVENVSTPSSEVNVENSEGVLERDNVDEKVVPMSPKNVEEALENNQDKEVATKEVADNDKLIVQSEGVNKATDSLKSSEDEVSSQNKASLNVKGLVRSKATEEQVATSIQPASKLPTLKNVIPTAAGGSIARGDDYPARFKNKGENGIDDWGLVVNNCTSFVAHRLNSVNKFNISWAYGNGRDWGYHAKRDGYRVDKAPALGSVAWIDDGGYGHVAWVSNVLGNNVEIEEYNYAWSRSYNKRIVSANSLTGFIHFKDIANGGSVSPAPNPHTGNQGVPSSGVYHFTKRASIKAEPKMSSPELAYYDAGQTVNYDKVLQADGHQWISYLSFAGNRRYIAIGELAKPISHAPLKGKITIQNKNEQTGNFDVIISDVSSPKGVKLVSVPVWSSENGQDDLVWSNATRQANGTYKVTIKASDHKNSTGEYNVHLYYVQDDGQLVCVTGTKTNVTINPAASKVRGTITIQNKNDQEGTFDVVVSNVYSPLGVKTVSLPNWSSENGQDDLTWTNATKQADGTYKATIRVSDHKFSTGEYNVHLYYVQNDDKLVCVGGTKTSISISPDKVKLTGKITIQNKNNQDGSFDVIISDVFSPKGVKTVSVPVWSSENGQDDLTWTTASKQANGTYKMTVRVSEHKNSTGEYNIHLYYVQDDGQLVCVTGTKTDIAKSKPTVSIPAQGVYHFTGYAAIRAEASLSSPVLSNFANGYSVNYDKVLQAEGHRRYVAID